MADPNEPRLLTEPRPFTREKDDHVTGDAGRDGFTRLAAARPQPRPENYGEYVPPGGMDPVIGQRDYRFGPRTNEE